MRWIVDSRVLAKGVVLAALLIGVIRHWPQDGHTDIPLAQDLLFTAAYCWIMASPGLLMLLATTVPIEMSNRVMMIMAASLQWIVVPMSSILWPIPLWAALAFMKTTAQNWRLEKPDDMSLISFCRVFSGLITFGLVLASLNTLLPPDALEDEPLAASVGSILLTGGGIGVAAWAVRRRDSVWSR